MWVIGSRCTVYVPFRSDEKSTANPRVQSSTRSKYKIMIEITTTPSTIQCWLYRMKMKTLSIYWSRYIKLILILHIIFLSKSAKNSIYLSLLIVVFKNKFFNLLYYIMKKHQRLLTLRLEGINNSSSLSLESSSSRSR